MGFEMMTANNHEYLAAREEHSTSVKVLAIICFTGFAIPVSIVAMGEFGILGLALAAFLGWQWTRLAGLGGRGIACDRLEQLRPQVDAAPASSGNASFDAYRDDLMGRLEREQNEFDNFLTRLRDAKDKAEFDTFLDDRARSFDTERNTAPLPA